MGPGRRPGGGGVRGGPAPPLRAVLLRRCRGRLRAGVGRGPRPAQPGALGARRLRGRSAGHPGARDGELASSSSQPSLMAMMLTALEVRRERRPRDRRRHRLQRGAARPPSRPLLGDHGRPRPGDHRVRAPAPGRRRVPPDRRHRDELAGSPSAPPRPDHRHLHDLDPAAGGSPSAVPAPASWRRWPPAVAPRVRDAEHAEGRFLHTPAYFVPLRGASRPRSRSRRTRASCRAWARGDELFRFLLTLAGSGLDPYEAYELWERESRPVRQRYGSRSTARTPGRGWTTPGAVRLAAARDRP